jgi:hypothetical protein
MPEPAPAQPAEIVGEVPTMRAETCSVSTAARRLGLSRSKAYALARQDALPVPVLRFGRKLAIPTRALDRVLGIQDMPVLGEHGA